MIAPHPTHTPRACLPAALLISLILALLALPACRRAPADAAAPARVAAAANLSLAFTEAGRAFTARTGQAVTFSFGSSGMLSKQIRQGAPFDLFAAADTLTAQQVVDAGACDAATLTPYARGRVALWSLPSPAHPPPRTLSDLAAPHIKRVAIAHPDHAPYGRAAKQALEAQGLWPAVAPKLILAESIRHALQIAQTGDADAALVALSLVIDDTQHPWHLIDDALHQPLDQALVVCGGGQSKSGGAAFAAFLSSPEGRAILQRHGFTIPDAAPTPPAEPPP